MKKIIFIFLFFPISLFAQESTFNGLRFEIHDDIESACDTSFDQTTNSRTVFRVFYPITPEKLWPVLIDINGWKTTHPNDYSDTRTLNNDQYQLVETNKPADLNTFYSLIGEQNFPSEYGRVKNGEWMSVAFQRFNLPWPLKDRWVVIKVKNDETKAAEGRYRYEYKMVGGNFKNVRGYWEIYPLENRPGWTEFRGMYEVDPGIDVPHFLAKTLFKASVRRTAKENLEFLEKTGFPSSRK